MTSTPEAMWRSYHEKIGVMNPPELRADIFCDNEQDANELAQLVLKGVKRATACALWSIEKERAPIPQVGDLWVVKDWSGRAICITKTSKVTIVPFNEVSEEQAYREGEGDKSLRYWREAHKAFYEREFFELGLAFSETMPIVFEEFNVVYP